MLKQLSARSALLILGAMLTVLFFIAGQAKTAMAVTVSSNMEGTLVKGSLPEVYFVGTDNKRYVFPNEKVFFSWYADFSTVKTISDADLAALTIGGNVTYRPGTRLVKIESDPKVYAVGAGGALHWVSSEDLAKQLFGEAWAKQVDDVPVSDFTNYQTSTPIAHSTDFDATTERQSGSIIGGVAIPRMETTDHLEDENDDADSPDEKSANTNANTSTNNTGSNTATSAFQFCPVAGNDLSQGCCVTGGSFVKASVHLEAGTLIRGESSSMVYYYASNGKRYVFTGKDVMTSWYNAPSDLLSELSSVCQNVKQITDAQMGAIAIGGNVGIRPGTYIIKVDSSPKLYVVTHGKTIRSISADLAQSIFAGTLTARTKVVPDAYFTGYKQGSDISSAADYSPTVEYNTTIESELGI